MAEARAACHPVPAIGLHSFQVDPTVHSTQLAFSADGFVVYIPHPRFLWKGIKRAVHSTRTQVQTLLWPLRPRVVVGFICGFAAFVSSKPSSHWLRSGDIADKIWALDSKLPLTQHLSTRMRVAYLALSTASGLIMFLVVGQKTLLRALLSYHGWLFEGRKASTWTMMWGSILKYGYLNRGLLAGKPLLYAFQSALPSLKPPAAEATIKLYLESMKPIVTETEYAALEEEAKAFLTCGHAKSLQNYLWMKALVYRNYITDWWVKFVYLRGRSSLFIYSNFYGICDGAKEQMPTQKQLPRAASIIYHFLIVRQLIDRERLPPLCINNMVPLCMDQYRSAFNSARVPGLECDRLQVYDMDESKHVMVSHKGTYYSLVPYCQNTGRLLGPREILRQLEGIFNATSGERSTDPEACVAALTTLDRTKWASIRENYFLDGKHNRQMLDQIERAMFLVDLDDSAPEDLTHISRELFVGDGTQRWCDKAFSLIVFKNGRMGMHTEHTWADAPVIAHITEWVLCMEQRHKKTLFDAEGNVRDNVVPSEAHKAHTWTDVQWETLDQAVAEKKAASLSVRAPHKLSWRVPEGLAEEIVAATASARKEMADLDLAVTEHNKYGKGLVKKAGVSPDAWIQMALQLAYFRDQGRFDLTYESSMTRLFAEGRTETIRSCTMESCAWARSMDDASATPEERLALLKTATEKHTLVSRMAMTGNGIDRHLFGMYVVAVGKGTDSPFLKHALSQPWKLSTSQVPQRQLPAGAWPENGDVHYTPSGGFGPVADDGYGVSYCLCGDKRFFFHVSSKNSCPSTNSTRMQENIHKALADMAAIGDWGAK